mmetsp:Transcript_18402/g.41418  ORF Transcript_18402/g.41418 Transcript_18402/m.41418 type:complete len:247 (+) Transcript_18402:707-1447(+)
MRDPRSRPRRGAAVCVRGRFAPRGEFRAVLGGEQRGVLYECADVPAVRAGASRQHRAARGRSRDHSRTLVRYHGGDGEREAAAEQLPADGVGLGLLAGVQGAAGCAGEPGGGCHGGGAGRIPDLRALLRHRPALLPLLLQPPDDGGDQHDGLRLRIRDHPSLVCRAPRRHGDGGERVGIGECNLLPCRHRALRVTTDRGDYGSPGGHGHRDCLVPPPPALLSPRRCEPPHVWVVEFHAGGEQRGRG